MRVQMVTLAAGPSGLREIGKVYDVDDDEARILVEGGYALEVTDPARPPKPADQDPAPSRRARRASA